MNTLLGIRIRKNLFLATALCTVTALVVYGFFVNTVFGGAEPEILVDEVLTDSLSEWTVNYPAGNPSFTYEEITSPYDGSTALRTSVIGTSYSPCNQPGISKTYPISGNTDITRLHAYLAFTSTMERYTFPYVVVEVYDASDERVGFQIYYGEGVIGSLYAEHVVRDPESFTELSTATGDVEMDLSVMGADIDFTSLKLTLANYACVGQNSVTFDHLRVVNGTIDGSTTNTAPVAIEESFALAEGGSHSGAVSGTDADGDSLTFSLHSGPSWGTLTFNADGSFSYAAHRQPTSGFVGTDSFMFVANDGNLSSEPAVVNITITPVNDAPDAYSDSFTVKAGESYTGSVSGFDVDGDLLTFEQVTSPMYGSLHFSVDGSFTYTADSDYSGEDSFTYKANDGLEDSATATTSITIEEVLETVEPAPAERPIGGGALLRSNPSTEESAQEEEDEEEGAEEPIEDAPQQTSPLEEEPTPSVLGEDTFMFLTDLSVGMENTDVRELQKRLRQEGFFVHPVDTGYFGTITLSAVKAYQQAKGLPATGYVGPMTREILNSDEAPLVTGKTTPRELVEIFVSLGLISPLKQELAYTTVAMTENQ